jgi:hypothetical protein
MGAGAFEAGDDVGCLKSAAVPGRSWKRQVSSSGLSQLVASAGTTFMLASNAASES